MCLVCDNLLLAYYLLWRMSDLGCGDSSVGIKRRVCLCLNPWVWIPWAHIKPGQEVRVSVILVTLWWGGRPRQADPCELTSSRPVHTGNKAQRQSPEKGRGSMPRLFSASCVHHTDIDKGNTHATNTLRKTEKHRGPWWAPPGGENRWWREVSHGGVEGCMRCGKRWAGDMTAVTGMRGRLCAILLPSKVSGASGSLSTCRFRHQTSCSATGSLEFREMMQAWDEEWSTF